MDQELSGKVRATLMLWETGLLSIDQALGVIVGMMRCISEKNAKTLREAHEHMTAACGHLEAVLLDGAPQPEPEITSGS